MDRTQQPPINIIESITLPEVSKVTLDNGVPVYILNEGEQEVVKVEWMFKAGKWYEPKNLLADLTNRLLREGTTKQDEKKIADTFDYYGANFNTGAGFETAGAVLYCLTKHIEHLLPLAFEIFSESVFPENELKTIVANRKQRLLVDLKKNDYLANRDFVTALYGNQHPYGRVTEPEHLDQISTDDLKAFYRKYYHASNLIIILSGKFEDSLVKKLNQYFGGKEWMREKMQENISYPIQPSKEMEHYTEKADSVQSSLEVGNITINKTHPDFLKFSVLNTVFGGYFGSRLMKNIREDKGYTYGIYSSLVSYPQGGFIEIGSEVGKDAREGALKEIENEINLLRNELVREEELKIVKNYISGKILRSVDGPMKFSETLKGLIIYNQETSYIREFLKIVREITAEELLQLANKYLDYSKMYKISVG